jgi:hypothetical protein
LYNQLNLLYKSLVAEQPHIIMHTRVQKEIHAFGRLSKMDVDTADDIFDLVMLLFCKQVNRQKRRLKLIKVRKFREHPGPTDVEFDQVQVHLFSQIICTWYMTYI